MSTSQGQVPTQQTNEQLEVKLESALAEARRMGEKILELEAKLEEAYSSAEGYRSQAEDLSRQLENERMTSELTRLKAVEDLRYENQKLMEAERGQRRNEGRRWEARISDLKSSFAREKEHLLKRIEYLEGGSEVQSSSAKGSLVTSPTHTQEELEIMDKERDMRAVKGLDGSHLAGSPKPLSVQPYKRTTVPSPKQAELDSLPQQTCTRKRTTVFSPEQTELDSLPRQTCTRLFVKNIPLDRTVEDMRVMFSQYGKVLGLVPIPSRKNVIYMYMEPRAAQDAIDNLHGKAISKYSKPMIVELSNPRRSSRS